MLENASVRNLILFIARVIIGGLCVNDGWRQLMVVGLDSTAAQYVVWGVQPADPLAAIFVILELVVGSALVLGFVTPTAAVTLTIMMGCMTYVLMVNVGYPIHSAQVQATIATGVAALLIALNGAGRASLDGFFNRRR